MKKNHQQINQTSGGAPLRTMSLTCPKCMGGGKIPFGPFQIHNALGMPTTMQKCPCCNGGGKHIGCGCSCCYTGKKNSKLMPTKQQP